MKILITGANGQLGSEIKVLSNKYDWDFRFIDVEDLDLTDFDKTSKYITEYSPDFLINCAAYTAVDKAESDEETATLLNAKTPENLGKLARELNFKIIHISTDYVFSGRGYKPLKESDTTAPESIYGKTKLLGETLLMQQVNAIIIRTSWLYSVFGNNFVKSMIKLGTERESLGVVFDQIGDPTNAADLADTVLKIIDYTNKNKVWKTGIYHYSNEGVTSWYDFALCIMEMADISCNVTPIESVDYPAPAPRPYYSVMNKQKIKSDFDLFIPHWKISLKKTIEKLITLKQIN